MFFPINENVKTSIRFPKMSVKRENDVTTPLQCSSMSLDNPGLQQPQNAVSKLQDANRCFVSISSPVLSQTSSVVASVQQTCPPNQQLGMVTLTICPLVQQQNLTPTVNSVLTSLLNVLNKQKATSGRRILPATTKMQEVLKADRDHTKDDKDNRFNLKNSLPVDFLQQKRNAPLKCNICNRSMPSEAHLLRHRVAKHQKHACHVCGSAFRNSQALKRHAVVHAPQKRYLCEICAQGFTQEANLKRHVLAHADERPYSCTMCPWKFRREGSLQLHVYTHTGEKPHSCDICGKGFVQAYLLKRHLLVHTREKPFVCRVCGKSFKYKPTFQHHQRRNFHS